MDEGSSLTGDLPLPLKRLPTNLPLSGELPLRRGGGGFMALIRTFKVIYRSNLICGKSKIILQAMVKNWFPLCQHLMRPHLGDTCVLLAVHYHEYGREVQLWLMYGSLAHYTSLINMTTQWCIYTNHQHYEFIPLLDLVQSHPRLASVIHKR